MELAIENVKLLAALAGLAATVIGALQARDARTRQKGEGRRGDSDLH